MARSSKGKSETPEAAGTAAQDNGPAAAAAQSETGVQAENRAAVQWDDAQLRTSYANVCKVFGSREEITLLFGTNQAWQPGDSRVRVALGERIVLTPYTAKRLAAMLEMGLAEYEKRFGKIEL